MRIPPGAPVIRTPVATRTAAGAPDDPRLELGLASMRLAVGETLVGSCAVFHLDDRKPREVTLSLTPQLTLYRGTRTRDRAGRALTTSVTVPAGGGGVDVPFRFRLPSWLPPTFQATTHELRWTLDARTGSLFGGRVGLSVPIVIVDAATPAPSGPMVAAPALGDRRIHEVFEAFAARAGWRAAPASAPSSGAPDDNEHPPAHPAPAVTREVGGLELEMSYVYRGTEGAFLVSRLGTPSLGLGLRVTPGSTMRHVFFRDVEVGITAWDRDHLVVARSAAQALPFLTAIVPALIAERGPLAHWDDDALVLERPTTDVEPAKLDAIAAGLERLATAFTAALAAIPPPPGVAGDLAAGQEGARGLQGRRAAGDLGLSGTLDGRPVEVELGWDEDVPERVVVRVGDPAQASADARRVQLVLARPADQALALPSLGGDVSGEIGERLTEQLAGWPADVIDLRVADGVASAILPLPADAARPRLDAARVRGLIEALRAVLVALEPGASPYR